MNGTALYLDMLFGAEPPGAFAELRWRLRDGRMGREFVALPAGDRLARLIEARGRTTDLYCGVAPRARQEGTRAAVERCHVLYVDCDEAASLDALQRFTPAPSMITNTGRGRHAYWALLEPVGPDDLERANRRLAHELGADTRATDAARILRPAGTLNHKRGELVAVTLEASFAIYANAAAVVGDLADPPDTRAREDRASSPMRPLSAVPDQLADIAPPAYFEALAGLVPDRGGKVECPLPGHDDATPSCHVFEDASRGWFCHGCSRGGTIYNLAAHLGGYPLPLRGEDFLRVRSVLLGYFAGEAAA